MNGDLVSEAVHSVLLSQNLAHSPVLVAVSGGADSTCLLEALAEMRSTLPRKLYAAHLNHQLRGARSDADAQWLEDRCRQLAVPLMLERANVRQAAEETGRGIEETARDLRYRFLSRTAAATGCTAVAVAHTADDQAETILHHILRGTGLGGLRGMPVSRRLSGEVLLVRPLLDVRRHTIERWLSQRGLAFRQDESNTDPAYTRNRIRHELLPKLREKFNPEVHSALLRLGRQAAEVDEAVEYAAMQVLKQCIVLAECQLVELQCAPLSGVPRHLLRTCFVQLWLRQGWPRGAYGYREWDRLADLVQRCRRNSISLPGRVQASWRKEVLRLERETPG